MHVGTLVGILVGVTVGAAVGILVGVRVGTAVGILVGVRDGVLVGDAVGIFVGTLRTTTTRPQNDRGFTSRTQHGSAAYAVLPPVCRVTPLRVIDNIDVSVVGV